MTDQTSLEQLVAERIQRIATRDTAIERIAEIDALLADRLGKGTHAVDGHKVSVTIPERLSAPKISEAYPADTYPGLYKATLDLDAVKAAFAPAALTQYKIPGRPQVRIS